MLGCVYVGFLVYSCLLELFLSHSSVVSAALVCGLCWLHEPYSISNLGGLCWLSHFVGVASRLTTVLLETGSLPLFLSSLRLHFGYIRRVLSLPESRLPRILAQETISRGTFWVASWKEAYENVGLAFPGNENVEDLNIHHEMILNGLDLQLYKNNIYQASNSLHHDLYGRVRHDIPPFLGLQKSAHMSGTIIKARGGLLNLNANSFKLNTPFICTICNLKEAEDTYHLIGVCPAYSNVRVQCFSKSYLTLDEVLNILNGENVESLYKYLMMSLKYRNLILNEFDC